MITSSPVTTSVSQTLSPSNTCNSEGEWNQTSGGTNATSIGACYAGTVDGEK